MNPYREQAKQDRDRHAHEHTFQLYVKRQVSPFAHGMMTWRVCCMMTWHDSLICVACLPNILSVLASCSEFRFKRVIRREMITSFLKLVTPITRGSLPLHTWRDSLMCVASTHILFACVTCYTSFARGSPPLHTWHDSLMCVACLIHVCGMT